MTENSTLKTVVVFAPFTSTRLTYILDWLFNEQLKTGYKLVHDEAAVNALPFFVSYGKVFANACCIPASGLLQENDIKEHQVATASWNNIPTLYAAAKDGDYTLPFDLLAAAFFFTVAL